MDNEKGFENFVQNKIGYQKTVVMKFPPKVYDKFKDYASNNANDCFWLAIQQLLEKNDINTMIDIKTVLLMDRDTLLEQEINVLKNKLDGLYKLIDDYSKQEEKPEERKLSKKFYSKRNEAETNE